MPDTNTLRIVGSKIAGITCYLRINTETGKLDYSLDGKIWNDLASSIDTAAVQELIDQSIINKVDKVDGKELSTNDFTNEFKNKLEELKSGYQGYFSNEESLKSSIPVGQNSYFAVVGDSIYVWDSEWKKISGNAENSNLFGEWISFQPTGNVTINHNFGDKFSVNFIQLLDDTDNLYDLSGRLKYNDNSIVINYNGLECSGTHKIRFTNSLSTMSVTND